MKPHKLLIVANNCLSHHNSNGRSLLNMLGEFNRESLCQIYTSGEFADSNYVGESLRVTNGDVVKSYLGKTPQGDIHNHECGDDAVAHQSNYGKKTALTMLLRDIAWNHSPLLKNYILPWVKEQKPDAVILQIGDSTLLLTIAMKIADTLCIPIVTYNTEDYYFKNYDYMKHSFHAGISYRIFHRKFRRSFKKLMSHKPQCVYNCEDLRLLYENEFHDKGHVIYCSTDFRSVKDGSDNENGSILYAGNLGVGRHKSLMEIGKALQAIDSSLVLDVYGKADETVEKELGEAQGIRLHGFVPYEKICEEIEKSRLLIHVESFDSFMMVDTKYAFSTKLADYAKSGVPMLIYAPEGAAGARYMLGNKATFFAKNANELEECLKNALYKEELRKITVFYAKKLAEQNHDIEKNSRAFVDIIGLVAEAVI